MFASLSTWNKLETSIEAKPTKSLTNNEDKKDYSSESKEIISSTNIKNSTSKSEDIIAKKLRKKQKGLKAPISPSVYYVDEEENTHRSNEYQHNKMNFSVSITAQNEFADNSCLMINTKHQVNTFHIDTETKELQENSRMCYMSRPNKFSSFSGKFLYDESNKIVYGLLNAGKTLSLWDETASGPTSSSHQISLPSKVQSMFLIPIGVMGILQNGYLFQALRNGNMLQLLTGNSSIFPKSFKHVICSTLSTQENKATLSLVSTSKHGFILTKCQVEIPESNEGEEYSEDMESEVSPQSIIPMEQTNTENKFLTISSLQNIDLPIPPSQKAYACSIRNESIFLLYHHNSSWKGCVIATTNEITNKSFPISLSDQGVLSLSYLKSNIIAIYQKPSLHLYDVRRRSLVYSTKLIHEPDSILVFNSFLAYCTYNEDYVNLHWCQFYDNMNSSSIFDFAEKNQQFLSNFTFSHKEREDLTAKILSYSETDADNNYTKLEELLSLLQHDLANNKALSIQSYQKIFQKLLRVFHFNPMLITIKATYDTFVNVIIDLLKTKAISFLQAGKITIKTLISALTGEQLLIVMDSIISHCTEIPENTIIQMIYIFMSNETRVEMDHILKFHKVQNLTKEKEKVKVFELMKIWIYKLITFLKPMNEGLVSQAMREYFSSSKEVLLLFKFVNSLLFVNSDMHEYEEQRICLIQFMNVLMDTFSSFFIDHDLTKKDGIRKRLRNENKLLKFCMEISPFVNKNKVTAKKRKTEPNVKEDADFEYRIELMTL